MSMLKDITSFLYGKGIRNEWNNGRGFWYANPVREVYGLTEEQLYWTPSDESLCALWHVGHIAHRELFHLGVFLQGQEPSIIPLQFEVFGTGYFSVSEIKESIDDVQSVFDWVKDVRNKSYQYIDSLSEEDFFTTPLTSEDRLTVAQWLLITIAHGAIHIGRIQLLRSLIEKQRERAC